ncbi:MULTISPECIES: ATP-binding cassette domain-containing protein [Streptomyces]|uniref:Daunorubicin/doxorubicin resistance ABC transporter ATP-binding protein DrrA n=1 Tax=Streptomyces venezuelae TaxID=54571 RepID=A0A5P2AQT8_STRVZ|nr:ATP-binding cassette domain-containing protein [Streptomyces venezuelae]QES20624.1 daunorubicin/doxorubicin resistance ABC transporter ATP-binding protein DrrA [Streptomyces venezuelae]
MPEHAVLAEGLSKRYGKKRRDDVTHALDGFDLAVRPGTVHGLLGPNGAGKTTAVRILATLLKADGGRAEVAGVDVARDPRAVRARIGLVGQFAAVDEGLTGRQNLELFGRLFHLGGRAARVRAAELLDLFALTEAADKGAGQYSGGMRRRLDLAASMILAPAVLFLDEPTTGLDPRARGEVWDAVRTLVAAGTTVLLTTQYLDEADRLASRITVMDRGRAIADDTPDGLKDRVGGDRVEVVVAERADLPAARAVLARIAGTDPRTDEAERRVHAPVTDRVAALTEVARTLQEERIAVEDLALRRPALDDVFLLLTGGRGTATDGEESTTGREETATDREEVAA